MESWEKSYNLVINKQYLTLMMNPNMTKGEIRYYTTGDANEKADVGYITDEKIIGVTKARIIWIGHPTIWFRDLFS